MKALIMASVLGLLTASAGELPPVKTVFVILMENHDWSQIKGSASAPFVNSLLPVSSYCDNYYSPVGLRPSEPNYLWLEAGTNFGIFDDNDPAINHQNTTNHLTTQLYNAGISWRTYQEDISGTCVPLTATNGYTPKHNPFVYFDDVTGTNNPADPYGIAHIRPLTELANDLTANTCARYNYITPNLCHDMHDRCFPSSDEVRQGDDWLATVVPQILESKSYRDNGALFIVWDEGYEDSYAPPLGMILLSPLAKGGGYACTNTHGHSSLLRTWQDIFGVRPLLGDAVNAQNLSELFLTIKLTCIKQSPDLSMEIVASGVLPGRTYVFLTSSNLLDWIGISTNFAISNQVSTIDYSATNSTFQFYRVLQVP